VIILSSAIHYSVVVLSDMENIGVTWR